MFKKCRNHGDDDDDDDKPCLLNACITRLRETSPMRSMVVLFKEKPEAIATKISSLQLRKVRDFRSQVRLNLSCENWRIHFFEAYGKQKEGEREHWPINENYLCSIEDAGWASEALLEAQATIWLPAE